MIIVKSKELNYRVLIYLLVFSFNSAAQNINVKLKEQKVVGYDIQVENRADTVMCLLVSTSYNYGSALQLVANSRNDSLRSYSLIYTEFESSFHPQFMPLEKICILPNDKLVLNVVIKEEELVENKVLKIEYFYDKNFKVRNYIKKKWKPTWYRDINWIIEEITL